MKTGEERQASEANKTLSDTVTQMIKKNQELESKLAEAKVYQKLFKQSMSIQCKYCKCFYPSYEFQPHTSQCSPVTKVSQGLSSEIHVTITQTLIREDDVSKKPYTEYVMLVEVG